MIHMKKIIFVTGAMGRGGAERVISLLSERYVRFGWDVKILMLLHNKVEYTLDPAVEVVNFSNDRAPVALDMPRLIFKVRSFIKKAAPDAVVAFMAPICLITGLACRGLETRLILSERNDPALEPRGAIFKKLLSYVYGKSALTVMQTERARNYFPHTVRKNSVVIPNPISVKTLATVQRRHRIVTAGRLEPQKNQRMLIAAFANIYAHCPEYSLDIYGEGTLRETLQQQINELGLSAVVKLKGNVPNIHEQIADAEMFVLSSDFEGLSNALLEAMMMGIPCISTRCAGSDEVIRDGENGFLVAVGNQMELEEAMRRLINEPALSERIGEAAKVDSAQFTVDCVTTQWRKVIEG